ncbi:DNA-binding transcriptional regulator, LysR family [Agrococcus baldri]|uniref:DNA-binding transcriptional regulator, LysR family n=1 Tax=Agrococcus baldri TaxID=153730 RepID=A0AA94HMM4_9MICO|nr:LysR family transcriptional regulator [Agrococcus baldri]SFS11516.1 DNA-binding transcriptional regulator, LysR family [Agrococcus baldri]
MELSHLRVFVAVARHSNITRAATSLHLTPSPVSRTIRELEREIGSRLFERSYHSLELTPAGDELLPSAVEMLRIAGEILGEPRPPLRLGATPWAPSRFAKRLRAAADEAWDGPIEFEEAMSSELLPKLKFGELDAVLVHLPVDMPGVESRVVAEYHLELARFPRSADAQERESPGSETVLILPIVLQRRTMEHTVTLLNDAGYTHVEEIAFSDLLTVGPRMRRTGASLMTTRATDTPIGALVDMDELEFRKLGSGDDSLQLGLVTRTTEARIAPVLLQIAHMLAPAGSKPEVI